jgi:RecB family exonuclease
VLERRGASSTTSQQQIEGIVVHALVDGLAKGVHRSDLVAEMERFLSLQTQLPPWLLARTRRALEAMLNAAQVWLADLGPDRSLAGSEVRLSVAVPPDDDSGAGPREVRLEGRADRLDRAPDGSLVVVDFKTGATVPSKASVAENAQLAVYQLAIELGAADGIGSEPGTWSATITPAPGDGQGHADAVTHDPPLEEPPPDDWIDEGFGDPEGADDPYLDPVRRERSGGAELVYLRSGTPNIRQQGPLDPESALGWRRTVRDAAEAMASSVSVAQENRYCERCPVRSCCPLQPEGRQVTR